jgi:hypothetical protein
LLACDPSLPCLAVVARWRLEQPEWDQVLRKAMRAGRLMRQRRESSQAAEALVEEIGDRIMFGASLRSVGARADMPCARTLYAWMARLPGFEAEILRRCDLRDVWLADQMMVIWQDNAPLGLAETKRQVAPLRKQLNRLAKRPGWKRRSQHSEG